MNEAFVKSRFIRQRRKLSQSSFSTVHQRNTYLHSAILVVEEKAPDGETRSDEYHEKRETDRFPASVFHSSDVRGDGEVEKIARRAVRRIFTVDSAQRALTGVVGLGSAEVERKTGLESVECRVSTCSVHTDIALNSFVPN